MLSVHEPRHRRKDLPDATPLRLYAQQLSISTMAMPQSRQDDDDDNYFISLQDQRVFGAGIRKKGVSFVRSSEYELKTTELDPESTSNTNPSGGNIANTYLSIVLPKHSHQDEQQQDGEEKAKQDSTTTTTSSSSTTIPTSDCQICNLPINPDPTGGHHESSVAHQVCLTHSHPPSHIDRTRQGFRYLQSFGWDPDSRLGLGAPGREGIREPVKAKIKHDTVGLGVSVDEDSDVSSGNRRKRKKQQETAKPAKVEKLNAKQVRRGHAEERKKGERLREAFYQSDDVQKHLACDNAH